MTPNPLNVIFGRHLRQARKSARISQEELGFRAELDRTYISMLERGLKAPTLPVVIRLCWELEHPVGTFVDAIFQEMQEQENEMNETKPEAMKRTIEEIKDRANACRRIENELDAMQQRARNDYERSQINALRVQMQAQRGELVALLMVATGEA